MAGLAQRDMGIEGVGHIREKGFIVVLPAHLSMRQELCGSGAILWDIVGAYMRPERRLYDGGDQTRRRLDAKTDFLRNG